MDDGNQSHLVSRKEKKNPKNQSWGGTGHFVSPIRVPADTERQKM